MTWALGMLLFLATMIAMEGFAYVMHRWVMHGPGWFLHASHHRPRAGRWELNDLYAVIFALPSILLLLGGVDLGWWWGCSWIGAESRRTARSISDSTTSSSIAGSRRVICRDRPI